jgi:hypothetical protein
LYQRSLAEIRGELTGRIKDSSSIGIAYARDGRCSTGRWL